MDPHPPITIVDDDPLIHAALKLALGSWGGSLTYYQNPEAFLADMPRLQPGIVCLDLRMPGLDGLKVQSEMLQHGVDQAVVFLSGAGATESIVSAVRAGAVDFLAKPFRRQALLDALDRAAERLAEMMERRVRQGRLAAVHALTERERQVLQGLADGRQSKVIAHDLGISPRTVEMHRANIVSKLDSPIASALVLACEAGVVRAA